MKGHSALLHEPQSISALCAAYSLSRVADAILALESEEDPGRILFELLDGDLDLLGITKSKAKDTFWELELFSLIKECGLQPRLVDPPDIVLEIDGAQIGIACKKLYSEGHVQNVLSKAVAQTEGTFDVGIAAINIDDLVPRDSVLRVQNLDFAGERIRRLNESFLARHERHFERYLSTGRLIAAVVSTTVLADTYNDTPRFNLVNDITVWSVEGLDKEKADLLHEFKMRLGQVSD
jgi:hypothetical protein